MIHQIKDRSRKDQDPHSHSFRIPIKLLQKTHTLTNPKYQQSLRTIMPAYGGLIFSLILLLFFTAVITSCEAGLAHANGSTAVEAPLVPHVEAGKVEMMVMNESRRRLGSFQICALCTCCGGAKRLCLPSPCCYAINCNIPNRPFGFCSFTPKTCNCIGCHL